MSQIMKYRKNITQNVEKSTLSNDEILKKINDDAKDEYEVGIKQGHRDLWKLWSRL